MDCALATLHALISCFSWSNLYLDGGLSYQDTALPHQEFDTQVNRLPGATEVVTTQFTTDKADNPYGRIALGYELRFSAVTLSLEASHTSSVTTDEDRGINAITFRARWFPFR